MKLSMYMALDALARFSPEPAIQSGEARLIGPQLGPGGQDRLYLMASGGDVLLRGGDDLIRVRGASLPAVHDALSAALAEWNAWERRLMDAAAEGSLQDLVDEAYALFDEPIFLTDAQDHIPAITPHPHGTVNDEWDYILDHGCMPSGRVMAIYRDPRFRRDSAEDGAPFIFNPPGMLHRGINMRFRDPEDRAWIGVAVIIEHKAPITIGKLHLAQSFYEAVQRHLRLHPIAGAAEAEAALLAALFGGGPVSAERAVMLGARLFPESSRFLAAVLRPSGERPVQHVEPMLEKAFPGLRCFFEERALCAVFPYCADAAEKLDAIAAQADVQVGLSQAFTDWPRLAEYARQARTALETGGGRVNELSTRSVNALCARALHERLAGLALAHPALETLAAYDARHHTALRETLYAYLMHERNLVKTAEALYIHRNSLVYRIRRITELTGLSLDEPDERLHLLYSFVLAG